MKTGLVLGKFLPLHQGHIALVQFALQNCDKLILLLCSTANEPIPGEIRKGWLASTFGTDVRVQIEHIQYNEQELPNTSVSSQEVSALWGAYINKSFPGIDIFISSETYGDYLADYLHIEHTSFDKERSQVSISASAILLNPFRQWSFISGAAKPWFVKKICISGSESTGKSTLTKNLAHHFTTAFVPEMAREIIEKTEDVCFDDLIQIAALQAKTINERLPGANKILICDTDLNITRSYSKYLFNRKLEVPEWIENANRFDMHIFLETDCPFIQDGTRLSKKERDRLSGFHKQQLDEAGIPYFSIHGDWSSRFEDAKSLIGKNLFSY